MSADHYVSKFVCICMVRNEQDVIEPFLAHHAALFDLIFIIDNLSTDRTREIIRSCISEFGNIVVTDCHNTAYDQSKLMSQAIRDIQSGCFADFIFLLDADEFLSIRSRDQLNKITADVPVGEAISLPWRTHVPEPNAAEADPLGKMSLRRKVERPQFSKVALRLGGEPCPGLQIAQGNHRARKDGSSVRSQTIPQLELYHFPVRSREQVISKSVIGWAANLSREKFKGWRSPNQGHQWREGLTALFEDADWSDGEHLLEMGALYAQDKNCDWKANLEPTQPDILIARNYSDGSFGDPLQNVSHALLNSAQAHLGDDIAKPIVGQNTSSEILTAFDASWHAKRPFVDVAPIKFLAEKYQPSSIVDLGCGAGYYLDLLKGYGAQEVLGVDGMPQTGTILSENEYICTDLQRPFETGKTYDLVMSLEVAEHLEPHSTEVFFASIASHAKDLILFSMAEPGQHGKQHINCLEISTVLAHWEALGWHPDVRETLAIRSLSTLSWFKRNLLVLKPVHIAKAELSQSNALLKIADYSYRWYGQNSGIRREAFQERLPRPRFGYGRSVQA